MGTILVFGIEVGLASRMRKLPEESSNEPN
jgi:hypothetical protein